MGTFSVDAKDAGRLAGSQIAPVTLESATTRLGTRQTQHSRRANSIRSEFWTFFSFFHFPYFHSPLRPILFPASIPIFFPDPPWPFSLIRKWSSEDARLFKVPWEFQPTGCRNARKLGYFMSSPSLAEGWGRQKYLYIKEKEKNKNTPSYCTWVWPPWGSTDKAWATARFDSSGIQF